MNTKIRVINLLKRGKARFKSSKNLVKNWNHSIELSNGYTPDLDEIKSMIKDNCRMGILGAIGVEYKKVDDSILLRAYAFLRQVIKLDPTGKSEYNKHSLKEVHKIYDRAIELAKKDLAGGNHAR